MKDASARGNSEAYGAWAWVLQQFLDLKGTFKELEDNKKDGTPGREILMPAKFAPEVREHSRKMIEALLLDRMRDLRNKGFGVGTKFSVPDQRVRWLSEHPVLWAGETILGGHKEKHQFADEHLFRAYGGASVKIDDAVATAYNKRIGPGGQWTVEATVTIRDIADFAAIGGGNRLQNVPGLEWLAETYRAGYELQRAGIHPKYWHTITFTAEYKIIGSPRPR